MEFEFSEEQSTVRELAAQILGAEATPERAKIYEAAGDPYDALVWSKLATAGLLAAAVPEAHGGMGYGFSELCVLLEEVGRRVAPVPVFESCVSVGLPLAAFGSSEQRQRWLPDLAAGRLVATAAIFDARSAEHPRAATIARRDRGGYVLDGAKRFVVAGAGAGLLLVPATCEGRASWFLVLPDDAGVSLVANARLAGMEACELELADVFVGEERLLGGAEADGAAIGAWLEPRLLAATAALQAGVSAGALALTSDYVRERHQFGVPIGSFQAVQHRCADCYIDLEAMRWTMWSAAWRIDAGRDAVEAARVAKFWSADGGSRIANASMHLHGGIGSDVDYPIHRYFLWSKALELRGGGAAPQLVALGDDMARTGPQERT
jgi:alkylation response protein AidB-like acyl-CoA dehydrogenase